MWTRNEYRSFPPTRRLVGGSYGFGHNVVIRGQVADRIGAGRVAGELERLATAPAEVEFAAVATSARIRHPVRSAEAPEEG